MTQETIIQCTLHTRIAAPLEGCPPLDTLHLESSELTWRGRSGPLVSNWAESFSNDGYKSMAEFWRGPAELISCAPAASRIIVVLDHREKLI